MPSQPPDNYVGSRKRGGRRGRFFRNHASKVNYPAKHASAKGCGEICYVFPGTVPWDELDVQHPDNMTTLKHALSEASETDYKYKCIWFVRNFRLLFHVRCTADSQLRIFWATTQTMPPHVSRDTLPQGLVRIVRVQQCVSTVYIGMSWAPAHVCALMLRDSGLSHRSRTIAHGMRHDNVKST